MQKIMSAKEQYEAFIRQFPDLPVMLQPWWLDAVCAGKHWDVMLITRSELQTTGWWQRKKSEQEESAEAGSDIVAAMPYLLRKRMGYQFILMPQMTIYSGVWMNSDIFGSPELQKQLAKVIAKRLRAMKIAYFYQHFPTGNPLPHWLAGQGFNVEQRVTYRIEDLTTLDDPEESFSKNKKRQLHKAEGLQLDFDMSAEEFYGFHKQCMAERNSKLSYSREFLLVLERKTRRAGNSAILRITRRIGDDHSQQTVAAAFIVWDKRYLYYLIPAYLPSAAETGASARLADEAIHLAKEKGLQFDFEGGNNSEGIASHYQQFGAKPATYCSVSKIYRPSFAMVLRLNKLQEKLKGIR